MESQEAEWSHRLLLRRSVSNPTDFAYYFVFAPASAGLEEGARVAGSRWTIEGVFEGAKQEVGLDEYEVRSWTGWYRYITLSLLAYACLATLRSTCRDGGTAFPSEDTIPREEEKGGRASDLFTVRPSRSRPPSDPPDDPGDTTVAREVADFCPSFLGRGAPMVKRAEEAPSASQTLPLPPPTTPSLDYLLL